MTNSSALEIADNAFQGLYKKMPGDGESTNPDATVLAWTTSYIMMAMLSYYEYKQDTSLIDKLVIWIDNMLQTRDNITGKVDAKRKKILPAWSTTQITGENYCWIVQNGMIGYAITWTTKIILSDATLRSKYGSKANGYVADMVDLVASFDEDWISNVPSNPPTGQYRSAYYGQFLPFNQQNAMGRMLLLLFDLTDKSTYLHHVTRLANFQLVNLNQNNGAYVWKYAPKGGHNYGPVEDVSHGAIDVDFAWMCYTRNIAFTQSDMQAFVKTLKVCTKTDGYSKTVDGNGGADAKTSFQMGRWGHLGYIDQSVITDNLIDYYEKITWSGDNVPCMLSAAYMCQVLSGSSNSLMASFGKVSFWDRILNSIKNFFRRFF